ncbi:GNAT family N-acetyltransferase [Providencia huashanensis]|uniref:GNAT family N-acetyltransferase n=1 Tax=Providencia huashanensis TaxID=3037798 RepID=UPI002ABC2563|nr:GNAT family N-acetyltransferase [Providencia rettgeri]
MEIVKLDKNIHNRAAFDCGESDLNNYLGQTANQHVKKEVARTFVLSDSTIPNKVVGFYALSITKVSLTELPPKLASLYPNEVYCALISRLAVDLTEQNKGYGGVVLIDAVKRIIAAAEDMPVPMIIVDAKNTKAKKWYEGYGFKSLPNQPNRLFMPVKAARDMLGAG